MCKKRGQNQSSVYQRGSDRRWVTQIIIQKKHSMKYFYSQTEADAWLKQALLKISQGIPLGGTEMSLSVYFASWLEIISLALRPKTWIRYQQVVNKHILPGLGHFSIQGLRPDQIQAFYRWKQQDGASARTLSLINCILHHAMEYAVANGFIFRIYSRGRREWEGRFPDQFLNSLESIEAFQSRRIDHRSQSGIGIGAPL